jgi:hypothetical protein
MARTIQFEGRQIQVPDDATDEEVNELLSAQPAAAPAVAAAPAPKATPSVVTDVPASFGSGIVRGAAETAMLPVTVERLGSAGIGLAADKAGDVVRAVSGATPLTPEDRQQRTQSMGDAGTDFARWLFGAPALSDADRAQRRDVVSGMEAGAGDVGYGAQDAARKVMDENLYAPKTTPGEFAETIGEFAVPGGVPSRSARMAPGLARKAGEYAADVTRNAVLPGVASEAAGQATEGTAAEPYARVLAAIFGNGVGATMKSASAPETVLRRVAGPADQIDWNRATALQNNSTGIRLTGPEAITQAQGGASAMPNLQRIVEGSAEGRSATAPFFGARPGQVDTAVGRVLDQVAPQSANPSVLGPRAADAATQAVRDVEQQRTAAVRPIYQAAATDAVPADDINAILADIGNTVGNDRTGVLSGPLNDLRNRLTATPANAGTPSVREPVLGPDGQILHYRQTPAIDPTPAVPVTDVENLDRARKYFRDRMDLPQIGQDAITKEQNAAVSSILDRLDGLMEANSPNFGAAKTQYADMSRNVVQPIAEGPLGNVASAGNTAAAGSAILPQNPLSGSQGESADAIRRLVEQDPETTAALVRQALGDRYSKATTETQEGARDFAGAKFHKDVAGNDQRRSTLDAVLANLPDQSAAQAMPELLDVLQATGRRKQIGSATEFNRSLNADLSSQSPLARLFSTAKTLGTNVLTTAGQTVQRAALRNSLSNLADMFTDPRSVELIREAMARGAPSTMPEAAARSAVQGAIAGRERQ